MTGSLVYMRSGLAVDVLDPDPATIKLSDIAWALAHLPRYRAQTRRLYAVAAHSVAVSRHAEKTWPPGARRQVVGLYGLLHDAVEAYFGDVPAPARAAMPQLEQHENRMMRAIWRSIVGIEWPTDEEIAHVTAVDKGIVRDEWELLMAIPPPPDLGGAIKADIDIAFGQAALGIFNSRCRQLGLSAEWG